MNKDKYLVRIDELQKVRHQLLNRRIEESAAVTTIDLQLSVVRSELLALYALRSKRQAN
jgi:hypothetical protein